MPGFWDIIDLTDEILIDGFIKKATVHSQKEIINQAKRARENHWKLDYNEQISTI